MPRHLLVHFYQLSFLPYCNPASILHISQTSTCCPDLPCVRSLWAMLLILPALGFSGNLCTAEHPLGFCYVHLPLSTKHFIKPPITTQMQSLSDPSLTLQLLGNYFCAGCRCTDVILSPVRLSIICLASLVRAKTP